MPNVLIADDSAFQRRSIRSILERHGHVIAEAANGLEALQQLSKESFDLLVLDLNMPEITGFEVLQTLYAEEGSPPVIVLTSDIQDPVQEQCELLGAVGFLAKPVEPNELLDLVIETLTESVD